MHKIDTLIKMLAEFKEELNKNMNSSYGSTDQNMVKDEQQDESKVNLNNPYNEQLEEHKKKKLNKASKDPALAPKEVKIKQLQAQIDAGTYKPDAKKIADKMLKKTPNEASAAAPPVNGVSPEMSKVDEPHKDDPKHEEKEKIKVKNIKEEAEEILDMHKEECSFAKNGQWSLSVKKNDEKPSRAEKGMPLNPTKPKAVAKPMGANKKPVLASRHGTDKILYPKDNYMETKRTFTGENVIHTDIKEDKE